MKYLHYLNNPKSNEVGNKNSNTIEIVNNLTLVNVNVPNGFATNDEAYSEFLQTDNLKNNINDILDDSDLNDSQILNHKGEEIRKMILNTSLPKNIQSELNLAYDKLSGYYNSDEFDTAIRDCTKSINDKSYIDVKGVELLYKIVQERYASLFTDRAIHYRYIRGYNHFAFSAKFVIYLKETKYDEKYIHRAVA
jgi:pyruvate, water dikinase